MKSIKTVWLKFIDSRLSKKLLKRLYSLPQEEWIYIDHTFNSWEFPVSFYDLAPKRWATYGMKRKHGIISPVMKAAQTSFSLADGLRYHNVVMGRMTEEEFNFWIANHDDLDIMSDYYEKRAAIRDIKWWQDDVFESLKAAKIINTL